MAYVWHHSFSYIGAGFILAVLLTLVTIIPVGSRDISTLESISSLPFPVSEGRTIITEALAHADIELYEPVLAKNLILELTFIPYASQNLAIGIRENSFWYSYTPSIFYEAATDKLSAQEIHHTTITIPLTDKLADRNQTLDMLLFTNTPVDPGLLSTQASADQTYWELVTLKAHTQYAWPSLYELKDFIRSLMTRERVV